MLLGMFVATVAAGLFSGAAVYITFVEHPARLECGQVPAVTEFGPSYRRAAVMQASLVFVGMLAGVVAWSRGFGTGWLVGGLLLGSLIPFTLFVMMPTNLRLLDAGLDRGSAEAGRLLVRWGRFHALRMVVGLAVFVAFVVMMLRRLDAGLKGAG